MLRLTELSSWQALQQHYQQIVDVHMRSLFAQDPQRFQRFSLEVNGLFLDYSKNRINHETMTLLCKLAEQVGLTEKIANLFQGQRVNVTEQRPALHPALRCPLDHALLSNDPSILADIHQVLAQMETLVTQITQGDFTGYTKQSITDIVNIGIGGSHLGPKMVCQALKPYAKHNIRLHFLSNIHSGNLQEVIHKLDPARTLFIISSKSFTTIETLVNTASIQQWFNQAANYQANFTQQVIAITTEHQKALALGVPPEQIFTFWEWVGGRYSVWSAIGLPIALSIGMPRFRELLAGAHAMDHHFATAPLSNNMPVIMALLGIWYNNFFAAPSHAVIPYNYYLRSLPAYLQQLDMESNGKQITHFATRVNYPTGPIIWGGMGTDGQHAFHQLLHQGTHIIPADFIIDIAADPHYQHHQDILFASCLGQSRALMQGINAEEVCAELIAKGYAHEQAKTLALHKAHSGNRPSNTLLLKGLSPYNLGAMMALYEHKVFVQGVIWNINSFDQWGVELGKEITQQILTSFNTDNKSEQYDASTNGLIHYYRT